MRIFPRALQDAEKVHLIRLYAGRYAVPPLSCGTVRDYCDSCDSLPQFTALENDLKDQQRPWMLKAVLGVVPPGASLLEVGGGEPVVAKTLAELGYRVTVVDPYDGSGHGPVDVEEYRTACPGVRIISDRFSGRTAALGSEQFDCVYSISVLEHIHEPALGSVFSGVARHLKTGGVSLHAVDFVVSGNGAAFHREQLRQVLRYQATLASREPSDPEALVEALRREDDTYYLSAAGHNQWRAGRPYDEFPFRKVVSVQSCVRKGAPGIGQTV